VSLDVENDVIAFRERKMLSEGHSPNIDLLRNPSAINFLRSFYRRSTYTATLSLNKASPEEVAALLELFYE
jgi:hypothetical protein